MQIRLNCSLDISTVTVVFISKSYHFSTVFDTDQQPAAPGPNKYTGMSIALTNPTLSCKKKGSCRMENVAMETGVL